MGSKFISDILESMKNGKTPQDPAQITLIKTNTERLISLLKERLGSHGKAKFLDEQSNVIYVDVDIFSRSTLKAFIEMSVSDFNQTPYFTFYNLHDTEFVETFTDILIEGATIYALSSKALIEKGREFYMDDNGVSLQMPSVADMLNTQFQTLLQLHWEKLKHIKGRISEFVPKK